MYDEKRGNDMEFTHKFSLGAVSMDKMLEEYHQLRKVRKSCQSCGEYGQRWSCPEYGFDEVLFLREFKYMYLIGREYIIPRKDRQKFLSVPMCKEYCVQAMRAINMESWRDLMQLEKDIPGVLTLIPGHCEICDLSGGKCTRPEGKPCPHTDVMRFSLEGLGFDVDAVSKFEIGMLLRWPQDGHLPEKLCAVMAVMSNEKIPMDKIKSYFKDTKKNWLKFQGDSPEKRNEVRQTVKRQESWIDNQAKMYRAMKEGGDYQTPSSWLGYKSDALDSGEYVKNKEWTFNEEAIEEDEIETAPKDIMQDVPEVKVPTEEPSEEADQLMVKKVAEAINVPEVEKTEAQKDIEAAEEEQKYKWLGFKRNVEEASEAYYQQPIRKFMTSEESSEGGNDEEVDTKTDASEETHEQIETPPVTPEKTEDNKTETERVCTPVEPIKTAAIEEEPITVPKASVDESFETATDPYPELPPSMRPEPVEIEPEIIELPDVNTVENVLSAALEIAKDVVGDHYKKPPTPKVQEQPKAETTETVEDTDETVKNYKWLNYKAPDLKDDDDFEKGSWKNKRNY